MIRWALVAFAVLMAVVIGRRWSSLGAFVATLLAMFGLLALISGLFYADAFMEGLQQMTFGAVMMAAGGGILYWLMETDEG